MLKWPEVPKDTAGKALTWMANPWMLYHKGFRVMENVYFVGTSWVSVFLLDTAEGLVLIDCAMQENVYQIVDNIRSLGFDPHKIKKLLLTHGHFDHCGAARAIQEMSGCEIWIGQEDAMFFTERRDLIAFEDHVPEFELTGCYDYSKPIDLGNIVLEAVHCPGHTPGVTSFFFSVQHKGRTVNCAIHGGLGSALVSRANLEKNRLPLSLQQDYCESIDKVIDRPVDVVLPSHAGHCVDYDFFKIADNDDGSGDGFIDPGAWKRMLTKKKSELLALIESGK